MAAWVYRGQEWYVRDPNGPYVHHEAEVCQFRPVPIEDFETKVGPILTEDERDSDIETVGGLVFTLAGRVPTRGEVISHPSGMEFRVLDADARRIRRLRARRTEAPAAAA